MHHYLILEGEGTGWVSFHQPSLHLSSVLKLYESLRNYTSETYIFLLKYGQYCNIHFTLMSMFFRRCQDLFPTGQTGQALEDPQINHTLKNIYIYCFANFFAIRGHFQQQSNKSDNDFLSNKCRFPVKLQELYY